MHFLNVLFYCCLFVFFFSVISAFNLLARKSSNRSADFYKKRSEILPKREVSTTTPPARPPPPEIPKSPPKWPLRPGVMVHVKVDTKQNLCASRTQSPELYATRTNNQIQPEISTIIKPKTGITIPKTVSVKPSTEADLSCSFLDNSKTQLVSTEKNLDDSIVVQQEVTSQNEVISEETVEVTATVDAEPSCLQPASAPTDELINFTSSSFMGKILRGLRWKRKNAKDSVFKESRNVSFRGGKRTTNFLRRSARWFGSGKSTKSTNSCTGLFDQTHHISGITCSDSGNIDNFIAFYLLFSIFVCAFLCCMKILVVTYKRTPVPSRSIPKLSIPTDTPQDDSAAKDLPTLTKKTSSKYFFVFGLFFVFQPVCYDLNVE